MKIKHIFVLMISLTLISQALPIQAQELDKNFMILTPLIGSWIGHFDDVEEQNFVLKMTIEPILGGKAVRLEFSTAGMNRESVFYWDTEKKQINFLALTSNSYVTSGRVYSEGPVIVTEYKQINPDGTIWKSKGTWEVAPNGNLINRDGHTAIYERETDDKK